jgi:hypothetical protein
MGVEITVRSEKNTKHINREKEIFQFLSLKPVGAHNQ